MYAANFAFKCILNDLRWDKKAKIPHLICVHPPTWVTATKIWYWKGGKRDSVVWNIDAYIQYMFTWMGEFTFTILITVYSIQSDIITR